MTFFLIVPSVMVVSSFLVHAICNRLGLRIHFLTLVMCSMLAIAANLGALAWTDVPSKFYFIKLGGIIFFAALATTATNYFLVKREVAEEIKFSEQVKLAYQKKSDVEEEISEVADEKISEPEKVAEVEKKIPDAEKIPEPEEKVSEVAKVPEVNDKKVSAPAEEVQPVEKVSVEVPEKIPEVKKIETEPVPKVEKVEQPAEVETPQPEKISKPELPKPTEKVENLPPPTINVKGETLDEILDYAYLEKQEGHTWQAIAAYKKALEKYRNDEYAPFVAIDLGNIYKEQAFYTKAIKTYEDALELPAVRRNASTKAEFKKNLIYLKTVQSVLLRHKALSTPFSKISRAYLQEIETEFQTMQLKFEN